MKDPEKIKHYNQLVRAYDSFIWVDEKSEGNLVLIEEPLTDKCFVVVEKLDIPSLQNALQDLMKEATRMLPDKTVRMQRADPKDGKHTSVLNIKHKDGHHLVSLILDMMEKPEGDDPMAVMTAVGL